MRFILSSDVDFSRVGGTSKIEYEKDFNTYKRLVVTKWNTDQVKAILKFWNRIVFAGVSFMQDSGGHGDNESSDDSGFDDIANAFDRLDIEGIQSDNEVGITPAPDSNENGGNIPHTGNGAGPSTERAAAAVTVTATAAITVDVSTAPAAPRQTRAMAADAGNPTDASDFSGEVTGRRGRRAKATGTAARGSGRGRGRGKGKAKATEEELNETEE
jgi:hypothetical protein